MLTATFQPAIINITVPPVVEETTNLINKNNVTEAPDSRPPLQPGIVIILQQLLFPILVYSGLQIHYVISKITVSMM